MRGLSIADAVLKSVDSLLAVVLLPRDAAMADAIRYPFHSDTRCPGFALADFGKGSQLKSPMTNQDQKIEQQAVQFSALQNIHSDLSQAYSFWSRTYVEPHLHRLFGCVDTIGFYINALEQLIAQNAEKKIRVLSIGCGDCSSEIATMTGLKAGGYDNLHFSCMDVAPGAIDIAKKAAKRAGLDDRFDIRVGQFEQELSQPWDVVMATQVLHHIERLEDVFEAIKIAIGSTGIFLTVDMIGRNGHMLWPEALAIVDRIWETLPNANKYNHMLNRLEPIYSNWDNSKVANEGIRAQDILSSLIYKFNFERFFAIGNIAPTLFGRHFGPSFSMQDQNTIDLVQRICRLDFDLIDIGFLKPILMFASLSNRAGQRNIYYKHWSPQFCVRTSSPLPMQNKLSYSVGQRLLFVERNPDTDYLKTGWSSPEPSGVWSNGALSTIVLPLSQKVQTDDLSLTIQGIAHVTSIKSCQKIIITCNGDQVTILSFDRCDVFNVVSRFQLTTFEALSSLEIHFAFSDPRSPFETGEGADQRELGVYLMSMTIT